MLYRFLKSGRKFSTNSNKPFFVTTPIFYVNAAPHIGHLYSAVIGDTICRFEKLKPSKYHTEIFSTGVDEHGLKIQQSADKHKIPINEYCDKISKEYQQLFNLSNVNYTRFIRTTEEQHKNAVQNFWNQLKSNDHIYSSNYSGWYSVADEAFLTETQIKSNPDGSKVSLESGHPVEWAEEKNYMFKLNKFQDDIIYWIKKGSKVKPEKFEKILLDYLEEPLPDLSISRPSSRVQWGIDVPEDNTQKIYVWLDALVNYLTCAGYPKLKNNWPPTIQVIGKDILKFHGIYWPAFLMSAGLEPPEQLLVHSHWTVDGQKMSKSKFNVVDPFDRSQLYTMEGLRYFLLREGVLHNDGNYSDTKAIRILNSELADTFGNLLSRCCAKSLNPHQIFPRLNEFHFNEISKLDSTKRLMEFLVQLPDKCLQHYESYKFYMVVDQVIGVLRAANNFFEISKPWELKKLTKNNESGIEIHHQNENNLKLETIISITMETLRICGIIMQPIIPEITKTLLDKLNIDGDQRNWTNLNEFSWNRIDCMKEKQLQKTNTILFKRIILDQEKKLSKKQNRIRGSEVKKQNPG